MKLYALLKSPGSKPRLKRMRGGGEACPALECPDCGDGITDGPCPKCNPEPPPKR